LQSAALLSDRGRFIVKASFREYQGTLDEVLHVFANSLSAILPLWVQHARYVRGRAADLVGQGSRLPPAVRTYHAQEVQAANFKFVHAAFNQQFT